MKKLTAGTRGSGLALVQTNQIVRALQGLYPGVEIDVKVIKTKGDKILDVPLAKIGDKGLFIKELESALLGGEIDFAVHSMKDLPTELAEGSCIAAVPEREDPSDVLVTNGPGLRDLPGEARVGTSSLRRRAQLHHARPDLQILDLRGNLETRLRKLDEGEFDAIVLAYAGLHRMNWSERITEKLTYEICLPAVGQGALAVQVRTDDQETGKLFSQIDHTESRCAVTAERSLLRSLDGGCQIPIGALARSEGESLVLAGVVASPDGSKLVCGELRDNPSASEALGVELAEVLLAGGAAEILAELRTW